MPDEYNVTEREYSWGTLVCLYRNNRLVMFVDVYNNDSYHVSEVVA